MILVMRTLVFSAIVLPLASTSAGGVVIDASYPGGNGRLVSVDAEQRVVKVATDPKGGKDYYWFNFEVSGLTLGVWRFKGLRLTAAGPAVSEDHGKTWRFLSPKGDAAWDEFVYEVKQGPGPVRFALSIPYQLSDWKLLMSSLPASPRLHAGTLCSDRSGRNVPLLEVFPEEKRAKMTLLFTARHHCCEASASHVLEGIVREVFSGSEEGRWVADNARVVVVPFMDLDGVENGEQGKHRLPHDHNRDYIKEVYPTVRALKNLVSEKYADVPVYFVDLHAPDLRGREHDHFYTLGPRGKVQVGRWDAFRCELEAATRTAALRHDPKWDIPYGAPWNDDKAHFVEQQGLLSSRRYFERLSNAYVSFCMEFGYGLCGGVFSHEAAVELGGNVLKAQVSSIRRSVEFDPIRSAVVETQAVRSAAMGRDIPVSIVLPKGYDSDKDKRWPVVFCLHGAGGDHTSHAQERERRYADKYGFIIVSPDGEKTSWWLDSPVDPRMRYETFLTEELIPYVDARYRTFACRERRAIMGGSMGGYGACRMGFRHKDVFGAVGNIYGGVDFWEFPDKWDITLRLGKRDANPSRWREFSVLADATRLRNGDLALITIVGTDDFFLSCNRKLHDLLARNGVEHTYVEYRGKDLAHSSHTMDFFEYAMPIELEFFRRHFEAAVAPEWPPEGPARLID